MAAKVILTGSTGNVGTYLLAGLLQRLSVEHVWCLNRSEEAQQRQQTSLSQRGLPSEPPPKRVTFLHCDLSQPELGLKAETYRQIAAEATHIIHCAWSVNWNLGLSSFTPSIRGVSNLIDFVQDSAHNTRIVFISSISVAGNWTAIPGARQKVPEAEIDDWKTAKFGYGQSKLVAERLLAEASRKRGLTVTICRVGQVSGPVDEKKGQWPMQEWFPSLVASSRNLGAVPTSLGPLNDIDWIPVDRLAEVILELTFGPQKSGTAAYRHVANPQATAWERLAPDFADVLRAGTAKRRMELVELDEWVDRLEASAASDLVDVSQVPAIKLLSFFQDLKDRAIHLPKARAASLDMKHTCKTSPSLANLSAVSNGWMVLWLQQWGFA